MSFTELLEAAKALPREEQLSVEEKLLGPDFPQGFVFDLGYQGLLIDDAASAEWANQLRLALDEELDRRSAP